MNIAPLAVLCAATWASALPAQQSPQLAEVLKSYLPAANDSTRSLAAGDVDGDGDTDLVAGTSGVAFRQANRLLLNDGTAHFTDGTAGRLPAVPDFTGHALLTDLDGDGDPDLVTGQWEHPNGLLLNDGSGTFTASTLPPELDQTWSVTAADVDGDGDPDLVTANRGQNRLYRNDGNAVFTEVTASRLPASSHNTVRIAAGDLDGDTDADLLLVGLFGQSLVYRNDGSGAFTDVTATSLPTAALPSTWGTLLDADGDGDLDAVLAQWHQDHRLLLNDGWGTFTDATATHMPPTDDAAGHVVAGDVDADGDPDLWFATSYRDRLLLNDGTGTFTDVSSTHAPPSGDTSLKAVLADLDGDGDLDRAGANLHQDRIHFNDGTGRFADGMPGAVDPDFDDSTSIAVGDVDGDGDPDLLVGNRPFGFETTGQQRLFVNDGFGTFAEVTDSRLPVLDDETRDVALGDVDGDGDPDLVVANQGGPDVLLHNDGSGTFAVAAGALPARNARSTALALVDVDGDTDTDIVVAAFHGRNLLYRNDGTGSFSDDSALALPLDADPSRAVAAGDVDGDGDPDLVFGNGLLLPVQDRLYLNDGTGTFTDATSTHLPARVDPTAAVTLGDVDGDGDPDLAAGSSDALHGMPGYLMLNDGTGLFTTVSIPYRIEQTEAIALADLDEDGDLDWIHGNHGAALQVWVNDGQGSFLDLSHLRCPARPYDLAALAIADLDGDGDPDLAGAMAGWNGWQTTVIANHHRHVRTPDLPRLGSSWPVHFHARPTYATSATLVLPFANVATASPPQTTPFGDFHLELNGLVSLPAQLVPAPGGVAVHVLTIPVQPTLLGLEVHVQALFVDASDPAAARFSNVTGDPVIP